MHVSCRAHASRGSNRARDGRIQHANRFLPRSRRLRMNHSNGFTVATKPARRGALRRTRNIRRVDDALRTAYEKYDRSAETKLLLHVPLRAILCTTTLHFGVVALGEP